MNETMILQPKKPVRRNFLFLQKKKLLMIHRYIEGHNSSNSKQSLKSTCEINIRTSLLSENFNIMKLP